MLRLLLVELALAGVAAFCARLFFRGATGRLARRARTLGGRLRQGWRTEGEVARTALAVVFVAAAALRLYHIAQPIRYDEAYTYTYFASRSLVDAMSDYSLPNNHILHTLAAWVSTRVLGGAEWALRLPVLVAGIVLVALAWLAARRLAGRQAGVMAAALAACAPILVLYSTNARGYMFLCVAFVLLLIVGEALNRHEQRDLWLVAAVVTALGMYTVPVMLYPAGAVYLWVLVERVRRRGSAVLRPTVLAAAASGVVAVVLTVALYAPVLLRGNASDLTSNRFVTAKQAGDVVNEIPVFVASLHETLGLGMSWPLLAVALALCVVPMVRPSSSRLPLATLTACVLVWSLLVLLATRRLPPARTLLFLVPLGCILAGAGLAAVIEMVANARRVVLVPALAAIMVLVVGMGVAAQRVVFNSDETDWWGLHDGPQVTRFLLGEFREGDRILLSRTGPALDYYFRAYGGKPISAYTKPASKRLLLVVNEAHGQNVDSVLAGKRDIEWARREQAVRLRKFGWSSVFAIPSSQVAQ